MDPFDKSLWCTSVWGYALSSGWGCHSEEGRRDPRPLELHLPGKTDSEPSLVHTRGAGCRWAEPIVGGGGGRVPPGRGDWAPKHKREKGRIEKVHPAERIACKGPVGFCVYFYSSSLPHPENSRMPRLSNVTYNIFLFSLIKKKDTKTQLCVLHRSIYIYIKIFWMSQKETTKFMTVIASEKGGGNRAWDEDNRNVISSEIFQLFY